MKLKAIVNIRPKVFAIKILIIVSFSSCTLYEERNCSIKEEEFNDVILFLTKSDTLIFKNFSNKSIAFFHTNYILQDSIKLGELPPPPMSGTIIISSLLSKNKFDREDISYIKCQVANQKKNEEQMKKELKKYKNNINPKNQWISFGTPFFSADKKTAYIKVDAINRGDIDGGHGYDFILQKNHNEWAIIDIHNAW